MDREEIVRILEDLVEADEKTVSVPDLKARLLKAANGDPRVTEKALAEMSFNQFQEVLVSIVNEVIE